MKCNGNKTEYLQAPTVGGVSEMSNHSISAQDFNFGLTFQRLLLYDSDFNALSAL